MTTPNIEELIAKLSYYSGDGVQIDMARQAQRQAADALQSQAERIKELEAAPQVGYFYKWKEAMHGIARLMDERDTLRAQLAEIEKAEPVAIALNTGTRQAVKWLQNIPHGEKLYTHPMPAQDVTELVELLEFMWRDVSMNDYAFEKLEAALSKYKGVK